MCDSMNLEGILFNTGERIFFHGSTENNLTYLKPQLSEHGKEYVYFSTNPLVALLYSVKPVPKPFSWYTYGFNDEGIPVYSEYFENAFELLYKNKVGYLYECSDISNLQQPTNIHCVYTTTEKVKIDRLHKIPDVYEYLKNEEKLGNFIIKHHNEISNCEMNMVFNEIKEIVEKYNLDSYPKNPMTIFIKKYFPDYLF